ncbi:hypothetical protein ABEG17_00325 [Pedococcus sp. KACC 23699]|uniref:Uncharacterized protein n=1 Tax=Pedococcus sp. KACC 23699 TaxID=3149228 RepID=A0AAU7JU76_9MICO
MLSDMRCYELPDPALRAYDRGVGTLRVSGEVRGYLASVVGEIKFPARAPWPWFVVVWLDGTKERSFEDYGPHWCTVSELDAGYFDHYEQGTRKDRRGWFGRTIKDTEQGPPRRYEFAWLPADEAAEKWVELRLTDNDF